MHQKDALLEQRPLAGVVALVVDPCEVAVDGLREELEGLGSSVVIAAGGEEAVRLAQNGELEGQKRIVLVDELLDDTWSHDFVRQIRDALSDVPVVLLEPLTKRRNWPEIEALGFAGVIRKPVAREPLVRVVTACLGMTTSAYDEEKKDSVVSDAERFLQGARVLVAEDNLVNQKVVRKLLEKGQSPCDVVGTGQLAVEAALTGSYDFVLMGCHMPVMDGYVATREIRRRESSDGHLVIVALTASVLPSDRQRCLAAGMDDFLSKPVRWGDIERMVQSGLEAKRFVAAQPA